MQGVLSARRSVGAARAHRWSPVTRGLLVSLALGVFGVLCGPVSGVFASQICSNEAFRNGPAAHLPDCRAYEMVSPPNKNGGEVDGGLLLETLPEPEQSSPDGEAVTFASTQAFPEAGPLSALATSQYLARRGAQGWTTQAITPAQELPGGQTHASTNALEESLYQGFAENLSGGFLVSSEPPLVSGAPAGYFNPYLRTADGGYRLLSTVKPPHRPPGPGGLSGGFSAYVAGFSVDSSRVAFTANDALTPDATHDGLYEWFAGHLELVSILPNGSQAPDGESKEVVFGGGAAGGHSGPSFGGLFEENYQCFFCNNDSHAISADGSRAFWTGSDGELYMRQGHGSEARTVQISASQKTNGGGSKGADLNGPLPKHYWTASADGSSVFFTSCEQLTDDSTAKVSQSSFSRTCTNFESNANGNARQDLYRYDVNLGQLTDLTVDHNAEDELGADVAGVLGASEDGSYVYFVARGVLASGAKRREVGGQDVFNLYLWHNGTTTFITAFNNVENGEDSRAWDEGLQLRTSRVAPDGRHLAFQSIQSLTGYDNRPPSSQDCNVYPNRSGRCTEVYEYGASSNELVCVSCNPRGLPPVGESRLPGGVNSFSGGVPGWQSGTDQQRYLSDDGSRVFFNSEDALLPQAGNGKQNVYEYEQSGTGSCRDAGGCVYLISTGTSSRNSSFLDASASGGDVFIVTSDQLAPQDGDEALDVYDVRVGGGFSLPAQPSCSGEACRPPIALPPAIYGAPPSATFVGVGNPSSQAAGKRATSKSKARKKFKRKARKAQRKGGKARKSSGHSGRGRK